MQNARIGAKRTTDLERATKVSSDILAPPKTYLDTCHLVKMARLRKGEGHVREETKNAYRTLDKLIRENYFGVIYHPASSIEWVDGGATQESASELADIIDSACLQYEIEEDSFVYLVEVLNELRRINAALILPAYDVMHVRRLGGEVVRVSSALITDVPTYFDDEDLVEGSRSLPRSIPFATAREHAERAWVFKHERSAVYRERVDGYAAALERDFEIFSARKSKKIVWTDIQDWIKRYLRVDRVLTSLNPNVDVDNEISKIDIKRCPAVALYMGGREKLIREGKPPEDNDVDDWGYISVVPYADLVLSEKRLRHFIHQADAIQGEKVTHDVNEALEILGPWIKHSVD